jgi:hypothetical protein
VLDCRWLVPIYMYCLLSEKCITFFFAYMHTCSRVTKAHMTNTLFDIQKAFSSRCLTPPLPVRSPAPSATTSQISPSLPHAGLIVGVRVTQWDAACLNACLLTAAHEVASPPAEPLLSLVYSVQNTLTALRSSCLPAQS